VHPVQHELEAGSLNLEEAIGEVGVSGVEGARGGAALAVSTAGVFLKIFAIEKVRLMGKGGGHPLPGEIVGGGVAVEQVREEPARASLPLDAAPVHHVGGQPHAGVIVEIAGVAKFFAESIHAGEAGGGIGDVGRHFRGVVRVAGFVGLAVLPDAAAPGGVEALPIVAPSEFADKFGGLGGVGDAGLGEAAGTVERDEPVTDVGRKPGDEAVEVVAGAGVAGGDDGCEAGFSGALAAGDRGQDRVAAGGGGELGAEELGEMIAGGKLATETHP
jgi:hypothetical protein